MSTNTLLTSQMVANELLRRFKNNLGFASTVKHSYDEKYARAGNKIGDTFNLRVPVKLLAVNSATLSAQDVTERKIPLVIDQQYHTGFQFTSADLTLKIQDFGKRYLNSAALALANAVDVALLTKAYQGIPNAVGVPGTVPNGSTALHTYLTAGEALDRNATPMDGQRNVVITPKMQVEIVDSLKALFQSSEQIKKQYLRGRMGTAAGFDWIMDQNVRTHNLGGLGGTPAVDAGTAVAQGATVLSTEDWTAAAANRLKTGDVFTIANVYAVNPVSGDALSDLRQFVVTADFASDSSGNGDVSIYPEIRSTGPYKTVSAMPADEAAITVLKDGSSTGGLATPQGIAYHEEMMEWAMIQLEIPHGVHFAARQTDKETGVSIRIVSQYDIVNDLFVTRCDIMFGSVLTHPEWGCRIAS